MSNIISSFFSDDRKLSANVSTLKGKLYVDFYNQTTLVGSKEVIGHSIYYAESMAENYTLGILKL